MATVSPAVSIVMPVLHPLKSMEALLFLLGQNRYTKKGEYIKIELTVVLDTQEPNNDYLGWLKQRRIKVIQNASNMGLAGSYNVGAVNAKYENIIFIHEDCVPKSKNLIRDMVEDMKIHPIVNGMVLLPDYIVKCYDFWNKMLLYRHAGRFCQALGKCTGIRREVFNKIGYFDDKTFRTAGEDMDFMRRCAKANPPIPIVAVSNPDNNYVEHKHEAGKGANFMSVIKKEWQLGEAHGAYKLKHNLANLGHFDFEFRAGILILTALGVMSLGWIALIALAPFILIPIVKAISNFTKDGWLPGLLAYPFIGPIIMLVQTFAALKGYFTGRQTF